MTHARPCPRSKSGDPSAPLHEARSGDSWGGGSVPAAPDVFTVEGRGPGLRRGVCGQSGSLGQRLGTGRRTDAQTASSSPHPPAVPAAPRAHGVGKPRPRRWRSKTGRGLGARPENFYPSPTSQLPAEQKAAGTDRGRRNFGLCQGVGERGTGVPILGQQQRSTKV